MWFTHYSQLKLLKGATSSVSFAGITSFEIVTEGGYLLGWTVPVGIEDSYNIYIRSGAGSVFSSAYLLCNIPVARTSLFVCTEADGITPLQPGTTYYCGIKAVTSGAEGSNTVELSNPSFTKGTLLRLPVETVSI